MEVNINNIGTIAAVDRHSHALVDSMEVFVPLSEAMAALGRPPGYQDARIVSWGHLTHAEAKRVTLREADENAAMELREEADRLFAGEGTSLFTLYYTISSHGE